MAESVYTRVSTNKQSTQRQTQTGGADQVSPPARCRALAALFPTATYLEQPDAGHFPWLDDPQWLVEHLTAWLTTT
ncbi:MAG: alpha/beta hydrolase [Umezawaea sp.]